MEVTAPIVLAAAEKAAAEKAAAVYISMADADADVQDNSERRRRDAAVAGYGRSLNKVQNSMCCPLPAIIFT